MLLEASTTPRRSLRTLPAPNDLPGDPWSLRTTKQVAELLGVDPACLTVWRYRGLFPEPEQKLFRGSVQVYRLDRVQSWLAQRQGQPYDVSQAWADSLWKAICPMEGKVPDLVAQWVRMVGPKHWAPPGCKWRSGGFESYLESLAASER